MLFYPALMSITSYLHLFQVNEGRVAYEQNVDSVGWATLDGITFTMSSPPASLQTQNLDIDISFENSGPEQNSRLLKNTGNAL